MKSRVFLCRDPDGHFLMFASHGDVPTQTETGWTIGGTGRLIVDAPKWLPVESELADLFPEVPLGGWLEVTK